MTKKLTYSFVFNYLKNKGVELLDKEYINNKTKLTCVCPNGHVFKASFGNLKRSQQCTYCYGNVKLKINSVKKVFKEAKYKALTDKYLGAKVKVDYVCDKGHRNKMSIGEFRQGNRCPTCYINKIKISKNNFNYRGGVKVNKLPLYKTYAQRLEKYHDTYRVVLDGIELLGIDCVYCGKLFVPKTSAVQHRIREVTTGYGGSNLYCSSECKKACPTFYQHKYPKGFKHTTSREVQPALRKLVLERDDWTCQKCGTKKVELHCHHIDPVVNNPIESADMDNCITLCKSCHKYVHTLPDCRHNELRCI